MGYPLSAAELELALELVASRIAWFDLEVGPGDAASEGDVGPVDIASVAEGTPEGRAQVVAWHELVQSAWTRTYAESQPPHVAAAFLLGWCLDALAYPLAYAAALGPWLLDVGPGVVHAVPDARQGFLRQVRVGPSTGHQVVASPDLRARRAEQRYRERAEQVARSLEVPGVRMSSRQRLGMVDDVWHMATLRAREIDGPSGVTSTGDLPGDRVRLSCCFIYALPGARECAACPRLARR